MYSAAVGVAPTLFVSQKFSALISGETLWLRNLRRGTKLRERAEDVCSEWEGFN